MSGEDQSRHAPFLGTGSRDGFAYNGDQPTRHGVDGQGMAVTQPVLSVARVS